MQKPVPADWVAIVVVSLMLKLGIKEFTQTEAEYRKLLDEHGYTKGNTPFFNLDAQRDKFRVLISDPPEKVN